MKYIKHYNEDLYNYIKNLHEDKKRQYKKLSYFQRKLYKIKNKFFKKQEFSKPLAYKIKHNALSFMGINENDYKDNIKKVLSNFENTPYYTNQRDTDVFWQDKIQKDWLSLNIEVQTTHYEHLYVALLNSKLVHSNMRVYDHGCGSGAFSLLLNEQFSFKHLSLADLDNYASEFTKYYIEKNNLSNVRWKNVLKKDNEKYDMVICLDVLEHLEKSYDSLLYLDSKLNAGGILFLKIAFECEDKTHLPQAAEDFFFKNDGIQFLKENYVQVCDLEGGQIVNGIFIKK